MAKREQKEKIYLYIKLPISLMKGVLLGNTSTKRTFLNNALAYDLYFKLSNAMISTDYEDIRKAYNDMILPDNTELGKLFQIGKDIYEEHEAKGTYPVTYMSINIFGIVKENVSTYKDWDELFMYLAIKSMIGVKKKYYKTNNDTVWARMMGERSKTDIPRIGNGVKNYTNYIMRNIRFNLTENWGLADHSYKRRGFYVSFTYNVGTLVSIAKDTTKNAKKAKKRKLEIEAAQTWEAKQKTNGSQKPPTADNSNNTLIKHDLTDNNGSIQDAQPITESDTENEPFKQLIREWSDYLKLKNNNVLTLDNKYSLLNLLIRYSKKDINVATQIIRFAIGNNFEEFDRLEKMKKSTDLDWVG